MPAQTASSVKKGFTLIELMITISIIAILATIGMVVYSSVQKNARISKRVQDLNSMKVALETYKTATGSYPKLTSGGCIATVLTDLVPRFMPTTPKDPTESGCGSGSYRYVTDGSAGGIIGGQYKVHTTSTEMTDQEFRTQPTLIDPARDGGTDNCKVDPTTDGSTFVTAWAIYNLDVRGVNNCQLYQE